MTTTAHQQVLTEDELECLRAIANGAEQSADNPNVAALIAKGMLELIGPTGVALTPAGRHAIDVDGPGCVPGIDN